VRGVSFTACTKEGPRALRRAPNERRLSRTGGEARQGGPRGEGAGGGGPPPPAADPRRGFNVPVAPEAGEKLGGDGEQLNREDRRATEKLDRRINPRTGRRYTTRDLPARAGRACHHCHELGSRDWWLWTWKTENGVLKQRRPYRCGSYRCPVCRIQEAHVAFARISESAKPLDPSGWCFVVTTLDRRGTYSGKAWKNQDEAFRGLQKLGQEFMRSLRRWFKSMGWERLRAEWVSTTEAHRSGWPHVNWLIWHPQLAAWLEEQRTAHEREGITGRDSILVCRELADVVTRAGFGIQSTAERAQSAEALASYIVKLSGEADQLVGEVTKLCQLPVNAPVRFRRLRSGKGFLPPRKHAPDTVGKLCHRLATWTEYMARNPAGQVCADELLASFRIEWPDQPPELVPSTPLDFRPIGDAIKSRSDGLRSRRCEGQLVALSAAGKLLGFRPIALERSETTGTLIRRTRWEGVPVVLGIHQPPAGEEASASEVRTLEQEQWEREEVERAELLRVGKTRAAEAVGLPPVTAWVRGRRLDRLARCEPRRRKERAS